ncbi:MAG: tRNA preQ1(34) S-adenosylmethionine ribosyltransferase-isomerase QueA [Rubripirellula sp.]|nr:tRNA preQ1(34) S-adenosylmethionine ribosyltransferase-isomerase QueA [Rubripirellula sp.]
MNEIEQYDYDLPRELIAQDPLATRSDARMMVVERGSGRIEHLHVRDLPDVLDPRDALVLNNSRVIPARLVGYRKETGGRWQGLFLRGDKDSGVWEILTKTRGKLKPGEVITVQDRDAREAMELVVVARTEGGNLLVQPKLPAGFVPLEGGATHELREPADWLERYGRVPLPPYIRDGQMVDADTEHYQTVFAKQRGSVAAPTAGLHFTNRLLDRVRQMGVQVGEVTLHVGIGTFRPIQTESLDEHQMHFEWGCLDESTCGLIRERRDHGGRCLAVGTTTVRVLESAARAATNLQPWQGETDIFIRPPFQFKVIDGLLTNFHLPRSSLLVLVSAFATRDLALEAYRKAIEQEYRFYSYGDAMFIY